MNGSLARTIVLWFPDWPVRAATSGLEVGAASPDAPLALTEKSLVFAASSSARAEGVRRGMRVREAQARCSGLVTLPYDPVLDHRAFEPVLLALEEITPGVQVLRPGLCAIRARGPVRYYGGEEAAAGAIMARLAGIGVPGARIGIADGLFAAQHAARATSAAPDTRASEVQQPAESADHHPAADAVLVVPPGGTARFLAPYPVSVFEDPPFTTLLRRLGVRTLGDLAALTFSDVRHRFGEAGARAHLLASGVEQRSVVPRIPPELLDRGIDFEPPLERIDQIAFALRTTVEALGDALLAAKLVCTAIAVEITSESGAVSRRTWLHPRWFSPADVLDRVRWQLQGGGAIDSGLGSPVVRVGLRPEAVDSIGNHEQGLWGTAPDERVHHGLSRVQSMVGHEGVGTVSLGGGRALADRQLLVPWGDRPPEAPGARSAPWPGALPPPFPATVFETPLPVLVIDAAGEHVTVDDRDEVSAEPALFSPGRSSEALDEVRAWAGPWTLDERWWDAAAHRRRSRFQLVDAEGTGWLVSVEAEGWFAEARYD